MHTSTSHTVIMGCGSMIAFGVWTKIRKHLMSFFFLNGVRSNAGFCRLILQSTNLRLNPLLDRPCYRDCAVKCTSQNLHQNQKQYRKTKPITSIIFFDFIRVLWPCSINLNGHGKFFSHTFTHQQRKSTFCSTSC